MKSRPKILSALAAAIALGAVQQTLADYLTYQGNQAVEAINVTPATGTSEHGPATVWVGAYKFNDVTTGQSFISYCMSPGGWLANGDYQKLSFADAYPGKNPAAWSNHGIDNAEYLFNQFAGGVGTDGAKGAGLALAMLRALYDSTDYGTLLVTPTSGFAFSGESSAADTAYQNALSALNYSAVYNDRRVGFVYRSVDGDGNFLNTGQDLITTGTPVPEPTTMIAGALLLLPFGASTLRILRRKQAA